MPIGNYPILEILIKRLKRSGITKFIIAVGYLESLIRAYFGDGSKFGVQIEYSSEDQPLGTAGPLKMVRSKLDEPFFFMNGDVLCDVDFPNMFEHHRANKGLVTVGVTKRTVDIDFGVVKVDSDNHYTQWMEKPRIKYLVSMGIYVMEPEAVDYLPDGEYDMPTLVQDLHKRGESLSVYQHRGYWLDIGRFEDYQSACKLMQDTGVEEVLGSNLGQIKCAS
jgi:NDP-sugar pyrophosphorylase family protein